MLWNHFIHTLLNRPLAASLLTLALLIAGPAAGQWTPDTTLNTEVSNAVGHVQSTQIERGPSDGTFVLWDTAVNESAVYLQLVDSDGMRKSADAVVSANGYDPVMVADGSGGVIVVWRDATTQGLLAARYEDSPLPLPLPSPGDPLMMDWGPIPLTISGVTTSGMTADPSIISDGAGGAIVSWSHRPDFSTKWNIWAQRIDGAGSRLWTQGGFAVTDLPDSDQTHSNLVRSGVGAFIAWEDKRTGDQDIWVRYVDEPSGSTWAVEQLLVGAPGFQKDPQLVSDYSGGAVIAWQDHRNDGSEPFAQRIDADGLHQWDPWNGVRLGRGDMGDSGWAFGTDGAGGGMLSWTANHDIHFQQVTYDGTLYWGAQGVPITSGGSQLNRRIHSAIDARRGGAVITWGTRHKFDNSVGDIFAQYMTSRFGPYWQSGGITVSDANNRQGRPDVVSDSECSAKVSFSDNRSSDGDATIQRIICPGIAGRVAIDPRYTSIAVGEMARIRIIGYADDVRSIEKAGFDMVFDPAFFEILGVVPGTLGDLETKIYPDTGVVTVDSHAGGQLIEGLPYFELKVRARAAGSVAVAFTRVDMGKDLEIVGGATVITVKESSRR